MRNRSLYLFVKLLAAPIVLGLALAFPSVNTLAVSAGPTINNTATLNGLNDPVKLQNPSQFTTVSELIAVVPDILLSFIGVGTLFGFLLGAYTYFTSIGNEEQMTKGKTQMIGSVVALFIVLAAGGIVLQIKNFFAAGTP